MIVTIQALSMLKFMAFGQLRLYALWTLHVHTFISRTLVILINFNIYYSRLKVTSMRINIELCVFCYRMPVSLKITDSLHTISETCLKYLAFQVIQLKDNISVPGHFAEISNGFKFGVRCTF